MAAAASSGSVVVVGGGIIGASIAYHLTLRGVKPTLIEGSSSRSAHGRDRRNAQQPDTVVVPG